MNNKLRSGPVLDEGSRIPFGVAFAVFPDFAFELRWGGMTLTLRKLEIQKGDGTNVVLWEV